MLSPFYTYAYYFPLQWLLTIIIMSLIVYYSREYILKNVEQYPENKASGFFSWLLIIWTLLVLYYTVFGRRSWDYYRYDFNFLYSYKAIFIDGDMTLKNQVILNVILFIPIGFFAVNAFKKLSGLKTLLQGLVMTVSIEVLQLIFKRGTFEFDDMLSNMIGTVIGLILGYILKGLISKIEHNLHYR